MSFWLSVTYPSAFPVLPGRNCCLRYLYNEAPNIIIALIACESVDVFTSSFNLVVVYGISTEDDHACTHKVVTENKWREVGLVFEFSPTTSASYALRKHYHSLLYHFEQLYFNKLQSPTGLADSEMRKAEEERKVAEIFKEKAMEEKNRVDQLAQQLKDHKQRIEELQKEI